MVSVILLAAMGQMLLAWIFFFCPSLAIDWVNPWIPSLAAE